MWQLVTMALSTATISSSAMQVRLVIIIISMMGLGMQELMAIIMDLGIITTNTLTFFTLAMRPMNHPRLTIISPAIFWMMSLRMK